MGTTPSVTLPFQFNLAIHQPAAAAVPSVTLTLVAVKRRHAAQLALLQAIQQEVLVVGGILPGVDPLLDQCSYFDVDSVAQGIQFLNGDLQYRAGIYLFNVIIALEWNPDVASLQEIRLAATRASEFLFDVTNGYMAIGQVIIGGPDLMPAADIQVMASTRIHPRAWMSALNEELKFMPIRVGRGLWQKNQESLATWGSPEGYRALIHEWGHYAFGLRDEYLGPVRVRRANGGDASWNDVTAATTPVGGAVLTTWEFTELTLAVPGVALPVESLMANTQISEYADLDETFDKIQQYYAQVTDHTPRNGPDVLSLPLPLLPKLQPSSFVSRFRRAALNPAAPEDTIVSLQAAFDIARPAPLAAPTFETHWLYLLKGGFANGVPARVIAQGKMSKRDRQSGSFRVLGAVPGDQLLLVSQIDGTAIVLRASLSAPAGALEVGPWEIVTPAALNAAAFFVDVIPEPIAVAAGGTMPTHAGLRVRVSAAAPPANVLVFPSGSGQGIALAAGAGPIWGAVDVPHLDGHVLLRWTAPGGGQDELYVCSYSQGGGPRTSGGGILPVTAGSADGNAMLFFNDNLPPLASPALGQETTLRIVTTTITTGEQQVVVGGNNVGARSYIFSVASNEPLGASKAALVLYYDDATPAPPDRLLIHRWDDVTSAWVMLTTYAPPNHPYVSIPIGALDVGPRDLGTAPSLLAAVQPERVERYRIFLVP